MEHTLINNDFALALRRMRRILPVLSFGLLIGTYLVSALIMGIFHSKDSESFGFTLAAYTVPLAIQAGRGTLVFFFQLNPMRIQRRYSFGVIAATALLLLSIVEAYFVMYPYGLSWTISVSTLMLIGWVIEVMILRETMFATQMELYQNQAQLLELKKFYLARNEFEKFVKELPNLDLATMQARHYHSIGVNPPSSSDSEKLFEDTNSFDEQVNIEELFENKAIFYGVKIDMDDPFLERNLARLESRFQERYQASLEKEVVREKEGLPTHRTIQRSIEQNRERLKITRRLRQRVMARPKGMSKRVNGEMRV